MYLTERIFQGRKGIQDDGKKRENLCMEKKRKESKGIGLLGGGTGFRGDPGKNLMHKVKYTGEVDTKLRGCE